MRVSEVSLGGWLTQGRTLADSETEKIVHRAFDLGINFFDTADVYNAGEAEKALGKAIKSLRREDLVIATKCYFPFTDGQNDRGLSRKHIVESVNNSLKRLGVEAIDLFQFHRFDSETPLDETVMAIDDVIRQGKVHYWGVSEWKAHQIMDVWHIAKSLNAYPPVSNQPIYNMLTRYIEEGVIPSCEQMGVGQVVFSPLAQGVLTGKYLPGQQPPKGSRGDDSSSSMWMGDLLKDDVLQRVQNLKAFAESKDLTLPQLALGWCLRQKNLSSVIVGATSISQLEANVSASGVVREGSFWEEAEAILAGVV